MIGRPACDRRRPCRQHGARAGSLCGRVDSTPVANERVLSLHQTALENGVT